MKTAHVGLGLVVALLIAVTAQGQSAGDTGQPSADRGRILLVLPFDNRTGQPSLEWVREAAAELLSSRFASAGFAPMNRTNRMYALDHLGLPEGFHPSRASSLKLAETLDADSIIVGSFITDGSAIVAEARVVNVPNLRMSEPVVARGEMRDMISVFDSLAWKLTRQMDPNFSVAQETFVAAGKDLHLAAYEQYIRGITEPDQAERLRHLNQAVLESPDFSPAWMALGREDYNSQQYEQAAKAFSKVNSNDPDALEAGFFRGLSLVFSGDYPSAERAFGNVARVLPLAEVVNDQGVAASRQGRDGTALFREAVTADPDAEDYHFNLAVSLKRHGNAAEALTELGQCERLKPNDSEAIALNAAWGKPTTVQGADVEAKPDPLERIERTFNAVAFRQAAQMLDQMDAARLALLTPTLRAQKLAGQANDYLARGLLLEAERLFQSAVAMDGRLAEAHTGLAEVRERTGDLDGARKEAHTALAIEPSTDAHMVLGRLALVSGQLNEAEDEVNAALAVNPASAPARALKQQVEARLKK